MSLAAEFPPRNIPIPRRSITMKRLEGLTWISLAWGVCAFAVGSAFGADDKKELNVGDAAPKFEAKDDLGQTWKSSEHVGKKVIVVYFYPADLTGGCTKQ